MLNGSRDGHREGVLEQLKVRIELLGRMGVEPPTRLARGEAEHGGGEDPLELHGVVLPHSRVVQHAVDRVTGTTGSRRGRRPLQQEWEDLGVAQHGRPGPPARAARRSGQGSDGSGNGTSQRIRSTTPSRRSALLVTWR